MTAEDKKFREEERKINCHKYLLGFAVSDLGNAIAARRFEEASGPIHKVFRSLHEFLGNLAPAPELTAKEAEWSAAIHAYMRKYWDEPLATVLYLYISDDRAKGVWYSFIKGMVEGKFKYENALHGAEKWDAQTPDDNIMKSLLQMWPKEDFDSMIEEITKWNNE